MNQVKLLVMGSLFLGLIFNLKMCFGQISALPRSLGSINITAAAYCEAYMDKGDATTPIGDRWSLYVSTFNPINGLRDPKYLVKNLGNNFHNLSNWEVELIDRTAYWPNSPDPVPFDVFGTHAIVWTSGFLVPLKTAGALEIYNTNSTPPQLYTNIAARDETDWSYHRVFWKDMDADGDLDALSARFYSPIFGDLKQELVWFENPNVPMGQPVNGWTPHVLKNSTTDVHFRNFKLPSQGQDFDCILSAEFFNEQLVLYYTLTGDWRDWDNVRNITLDTTLGQVFDVYVDDFNMDGKLDLLATAYNGSFGHVFVYEVPQDFRNESGYVKHTIADGFVANDIIGGQSMTPGSPKPFYPSQAWADEIIPDPDRHRKPYILVSGDDDGKHYILEPVTEDPGDWSYTKHVLIDTNGTTSGKFAIGDFDGDGFTDIVAAGYTTGKLYAFTYAPAP